MELVELNWVMRTLKPESIVKVRIHFLEKENYYLSVVGKVQFYDNIKGNIVLLETTSNHVHWLQRQFVAGVEVMDSDQTDLLNLFKELRR